MKSTLPIRPRRNRRNESVRSLVRETELRASQFVLPLFVTEATKGREAIGSMPGVDRLSLDEVLRESECALELGIRAVALFPKIPEAKKDSLARESLNPEGLTQRTLRALKQRFPELLVMSDVAMDPYSSDGHDGIVKDGKILNDETLEVLGEMAVAQAEAGADFVAPSDMMDGRVGYIRSQLDQAGFTDVGILSYAVKYASAFYGPFRDALDSAPRVGDKKTYQMDPANRREALREAKLDIAEGADILMVKPAMAYLDVLCVLRQETNLPLAAYQVSGEYAMIKAAAERGWVDCERAMLESLVAIRRAGADMIFSYFALDAARIVR